MKFLMFSWAEADDVSDISELTNEKFEELAKRPNGFITEDPEEFEALFNSEQISTSVHQLRIIQ